jgi:hypothetical protein
MANPAQEYLKTHAQFPRVELKDLQEHILKLENCKQDTIEDKATKKEIEGVKFLVKEAGELKTIFTTSTVLIQKLADLVDSNETVKVTQVKYEGNNGKELTTYAVQKQEGDNWIEIGDKVVVKDDMGPKLPTVDLDEDDIPVVEDNNGTDEDSIPIESIPF